MGTHDQYIKYVLGELKNKQSTTLDNFITFKVENKTSLVESGDNLFVINADDQFNLERNKSGKYRISGKLRFITDNFFNGAYGTQPNSSDYSPITENTSMLDNNSINKNWTLQITYPSTSDEEFPLTNKNGVTTKVNEGLLVDTVVNGPNTNTTLITTKQKHNLTPGEYVYVNIHEVFGTSDFYEEYQGFHEVVNLDSDNEEYGFVIDKIFTQTADFNVYVKRVLNVSKNDVTFDYTKNVEQIQRVNELGTTVGTTFEYTKIFSPNHGLIEGDFIDIRMNLPFRLNGLREVVKVLDKDSFLVKFDLILVNTVSTQPQIIQPPLELRFRRINSSPSNYYVRRFEVLTDLIDYRSYQSGYEITLFTDEYSNNTFLFHFDSDIDVTELRDNLGRPLSELFLTITKRSSGDVSNFKNWSSVISMWESDRQVIGNNFNTDGTVFNLETVSYWNDPSNLGQSGTIQKRNIGDSYIGDIVEYNKRELIEHVVSKTVFRFSPNTNVNNQFVTDIEGYYYYPHNRIKIREFSDRIRVEKNSDNIIVPEYVQVNNDGTVTWRDLIPIGIFEFGVNGVDYPFNNGCHYIFNNYDIYIRRQLPIGVTNYDPLFFVSPKLSDFRGEEC